MIDLEKLLKIYENDYKFYNTDIDDESGLINTYRKLLNDNQDSLNREQLKRLYVADKNYIKLYRKNSKKNNISMDFLKNIINIALKFAKKYEKSQKNLVLH